MCFTGVDWNIDTGDACDLKWFLNPLVDNLLLASASMLIIAKVSSPGMLLGCYWEVHTDSGQEMTRSILTVARR